MKKVIIIGCSGSGKGKFSEILRKNLYTYKGYAHKFYPLLLALSARGEI